MLKVDKRNVLCLHRFCIRVPVQEVVDVVLGSLKFRKEFVYFTLLNDKFVKAKAFRLRFEEVLGALVGPFGHWGQCEGVVDASVSLALRSSDLALRSFDLALRSFDSEVVDDFVNRVERLTED